MRKILPVAALVGLLQPGGPPEAKAQAASPPVTLSIESFERSEPSADARTKGKIAFKVGLVLQYTTNLESVRVRGAGTASRPLTGEKVSDEELGKAFTAAAGQALDEALPRARAAGVEVEVEKLRWKERSLRFVLAHGGRRFNCELSPSAQAVAECSTARVAEETRPQPRPRLRPRRRR